MLNLNVEKNELKEIQKAWEIINKAIESDENFKKIIKKTFSWIPFAESIIPMKFNIKNECEMVFDWAIDNNYEATLADPLGSFEQNYEWYCEEFQGV